MGLSIDQKLGDRAWCVFLFGFKNTTMTTLDRANIQKLFTSNDPEAMPAYWSEMSKGKMTTNGTFVTQQKKLNVTLDEFNTKLNGKKRSRGEKGKLVAEAFANEVNLSQFYGFILIPDRDTGDIGAAGTPNMNVNGTSKSFPVVLAHPTVSGNFYAHEMGHNLGLPHSYDDSGRSIPGNSWAAPGEYMNPYDIMGGMGNNSNGNMAAAVYAFPHPNFVTMGPSTTAPAMYSRGWLTDADISTFDFSQNIPPEQSVVLTPLHDSGSTIKKALRILIPVADTDRVDEYWIELRSKAKWDRNIDTSGVLIHRIERGKTVLVNSDIDHDKLVWQQGEFYVEGKHNLKFYICYINKSGVQATRAAIIVTNNVSNVYRIPGTVGEENSGGGIDLLKLTDNNRQLDMITAYIKNKPQVNEAKYRIGYNLTNAGEPKSWSNEMTLPVEGWSNQGCDICTADLNGNGRPDMVFGYIDNPGGKNEIRFKVGRDLSTSGVVSVWSNQKVVPGKLGMENQGLGMALGNLTGISDRNDLVVFYIDLDTPRNRAYIKIGRNLKSDGDIDGGWSDTIEVPNWISAENQGGGVALTDLTGNGKLDVVVFGIDNPAKENHGFYIVGYDLDENGSVSKWGNPYEIPGWFGYKNQGGSIAINTFNYKSVTNNNMVVLHIDNPPGNNVMYYRIIDELIIE